MTSDAAGLGPNVGYVEELYALYLVDPSLVGDLWASYFASGSYAPTSGGHRNGETSLPTPSARTVRAPSTSAESDGVATAKYVELQERVGQLVDAYRRHGHLHASINPLAEGVVKPPRCEDLELDTHDIRPEDMRTEVRTSGFVGASTMPLEALVSALERTYCGSVGFEFMHLLSRTEREWLRTRIESRQGSDAPSSVRARRLRKLIEAEVLESELHRRYVGVKRFSIEGGEVLIPLLDTIAHRASSGGVDEIVIGMAHRGRVNVLKTILGKPLAEIFAEFEDKTRATISGAGDVKYHLGYERTYTLGDDRTVQLRLAPNPSHLEFVNPVVEGMCRALQDLSYQGERRSTLPVLIHGDAAVIGQGVVAETLQLSGVRGFATGGTVHIIANNQVGFTTTPDEARSSVYCSDVAKAIQAPIFHVNGEDVDAACWVVELAVEFRNTFGRDVVVDVYCWRKYGHNEGDDPFFTQPIMYSALKQKPSTPTTYAERLVKEGVLHTEDVEKLHAHSKDEFLRARDEVASLTLPDSAPPLHGAATRFAAAPQVQSETLLRIARTLTSFPTGFTPHPKIAALQEKRVKAVSEGAGIEWGCAEALALGSLMLEGISVRLSGQDCGRGTFSHRHLAMDNVQREETFHPLSTLTRDASFEVYNSILSETAVMGFEFGYSTLAPRSLVMWEGQFGDFVNGAQVIIDQFLSSSESKWQQHSGLVLLLPHGYEGAGPEHSSARLERFLQLCAEHNMTVCNPSTAGQYFHMLRRHAHSEPKRPLIVMTPKSLLRLPEAAARSEELTAGTFRPVLATTIGEPAEVPRRVVLCSGKVYYDLLQSFRSGPVAPTCLLRLEQLYPYPEKEIREAVGDVPLEALVWAQEEPANMGAYSYVAPYLRAQFGREPAYAGRPASGSTATGSPAFHAKEQRTLVQRAIELSAG